MGGSSGLWALLLSVTLSACAWAPASPPAGERVAEASASMGDSAQQQALARTAGSLLATPAAIPTWEPFFLPGKRHVAFRPDTRAGRLALRVDARQSVSILRQRFEPGLPRTGALRFSWKVDALPVGADLSDATLEDAPARIVLTFDGDRTRLEPRAHRMSELSRLLIGEELPYATLVYVWSGTDDLETVIKNPRTDRIRKLVIETGDKNLDRWRDYSRDVRADFLRAFGEEPGALQTIALMTDTDNTQSTLKAWYGDLRLEAGGEPR